MKIFGLVIETQKQRDRERRAIQEVRLEEVKYALQMGAQAGYERAIEERNTGLICVCRLSIPEQQAEAIIEREEFE